MDNELISVYERLRGMLITSELLEKEIQKIKDPKLKEKLVEMFRTVEADLLIVYDFLIEASNCESEDELKLLLDLNTNYEEVIN